MSHPVAVAILKRFLGEDVTCTTWSSHTLFPGFKHISWHADYPYWAMTPPWPEGRLAAQAFWMLDDFVPENGATAVIPGSHTKLGHPPTPSQMCAALLR